MYRKINVVIPMAGLGQRFVDSGYSKPKPFIDVLGSPMIEHVLKNLSVNNANYFLIAQEKHMQREPETISHLEKTYDVVFHFINGLTEGTASTVLTIENLIDTNTPLLIANSDQVIDLDINVFIENAFQRGLDGSILVFKDISKNPKWSYAQINEGGLVSLVREKEPISDLATVGIYFFNKGSDFIRSAKEMIQKNDRVNNEFYTCPVYNYLIEIGSKIGVYEIYKDQMHGIGTPEDLDRFIAMKKSF